MKTDPLIQAAAQALAAGDPLGALKRVALRDDALRRLQTAAARVAFARAKQAAYEARIPALIAEVESASHTLKLPAARLIASGEERLLLLDEVEALLASEALVVDACRHVVQK